MTPAVGDPVAAAADELILASRRHGYAICGHTPRDESHCMADVDASRSALLSAVVAAVAAERERCAVECEFLADKAFLMPADPYYECAARIRGNVGRGALRLPPEPVA